MPGNTAFRLWTVAGILLLSYAPTNLMAAAPEVPWIDYAVPLSTQPIESSSDLIWYDDFDGDSINDIKNRYFEVWTTNNFGPVTSDAFGGSGHALRGTFQPGTESAGNIKLRIGRSPVGNKGARLTEDFTDVYWRMYVKHQRGWQGNPLKMSRATTFAKSDWSQAMFAHVWEGSGDRIKLDPASGVSDNGSGGSIATSGYNDFANMTWAGPLGVVQSPTTSPSYPIYRSDYVGQWVCIETRAKLNTPGKSDAEFTMWINGVESAKAINFTWRGTYTAYGINAIMLENWWNGGKSPQTQWRNFDNFVVSTKPIGLVSTSVNPVIRKIPFYDPDAGNTQQSWQVEIASNPNGSDVVWTATVHGSGNQITVNNSNGTFTGSRAGQSSLSGNWNFYSCRVRQQDNNNNWSSWSAWKGVFQTAAGGSNPVYRKIVVELPVDTLTPDINPAGSYVDGGTTHTFNNLSTGNAHTISITQSLNN